MEQNIKTIDFQIPKLKPMKKYPDSLYYIGNLDLLNKKTIGVVGSRSPTKYARELTHQIVSRLTKGDNIIVSGGAIGIDTVAHKAATPSQTIMVAGTGLDKRYPSINKNLIANIEQKGLIISQFPPNTPSFPRNFAIRNELTVALSDILIVSYADEKSGTIRSVEHALNMGKEIYVLPHRIGESEGTNKLLAHNKAKAIYDVEDFVSQFIETKKKIPIQDHFLEYLQTNPPYDEAVFKFGDKIFEAELLGTIEIKNGIIYLI